MAGGFRPIQDISGNSYTGKIQQFVVESSHASLLAVGDLVAETGTSVEGVSTADAVAAGNNITGPITFIKPNLSNLEAKGLAAGTAGVIGVAVDPNLLLEAEISNGSVAATDVGGNADIVATAATATGGLVNSNMTVDAGTFGAGTAQVRVIGIKDGVVGSASTLFVRLNESTVKDTAGV